MYSHRAIVAKLQDSGRWLIESSTHSITLTKKFGKKNSKIVSVNLSREPDGSYILMPLDYRFNSTISHFDYCLEEHRWARNKTFIRSLISTLKETDIWDMIKNRETFIQVNTHNDKINKADLKDQLNNLL